MNEQEQPQPAQTGKESEPGVSRAPKQQAKLRTTKEEPKNTHSSRQLFMKRTDFPYIVTLLFAFFSWAVTHAVDRLTSLPLVKLTQTVVEQPHSSHLIFEFENITSGVNFKDLIIRILGETPQHRFTEPKTTIIGIGWDGDARLYEVGDGIELKIPDFHPGWRLELTTDMTGGGSPLVQLERAGVPTIIEPVGLRTWLVEWELCIIAVFAGAALVFIIAWAWRQ